VVVEFSKEGRRARIHPHGCLSAADLIRWAAPVGLAAHGPVLLHASAVLTPFGVVAFMGAGGSGKSTLARHLAEHGLPSISDDVVSCDDRAMIHTQAEPRLRRWCQSAAGTPQHVDYGDLASALRTDTIVPLTALFILGQRRPVDDFEVDPLGSVDALVTIANHRLGTHPSPLAWKKQFQVFVSIVQRVPVALLTVPDGIDALRAALPSFECSISSDPLRSSPQTHLPCWPGHQPASRLRT
jgi:hypothetical protein